MTEYARAAWNAAPSLQQLPKLVKVPNGVVHHIGGGNPYPTDVAATLHSIQAIEQHSGYYDIAYNYGVDQLGNIWELRGDVNDGATKGYSGISFSVLAICNAAAPGFQPTPALIAGIAACFIKAQARGVLASNPTIDGHHWFDSHVTTAPTACPGDPLIAQIPQIRKLVTPPPVPPTKVAPMYSPTINVLGGIVASLPIGGGELLAGPAGHLYALDGAPNKGGPIDPLTGQQKAYFAGRTVARLEVANAAEKAAGKVYTIVATDGGRYSYPE